MPPPTTSGRSRQVRSPCDAINFIIIIIVVVVATAAGQASKSGPNDDIVTFLKELADYEKVRKSIGKV